MSIVLVNTAIVFEIYLLFSIIRLLPTAANPLILLYTT